MCGYGQWALGSKVPSVYTAVSDQTLKKRADQIATAMRLNAIDSAPETTTTSSSVTENRVEMRNRFVKNQEEADEFDSELEEFRRWRKEKKRMRWEKEWRRQQEAKRRRKEEKRERREFRRLRRMDRERHVFLCCLWILIL